MPMSDLDGLHAVVCGAFLRKKLVSKIHIVNFHFSYFYTLQKISSLLLLLVTHNLRHREKTSIFCTLLFHILCYYTNKVFS